MKYFAATENYKSVASLGIYDDIFVQKKTNIVNVGLCQQHKLRAYYRTVGKNWVILKNMNHILSILKRIAKCNINPKQAILLTIFVD